jgi:arylsulfatase A-like enzyme
MAPNVMVLVTHDTGRFVSPYGYETFHTPNCERLAAESVTFENAFCTAPQCSPSRAALFTGRYPHSNGVMGLTHGDFAWSLYPEERHAASIFSEAGYQTRLIGAQHENSDPEALGFDVTDLGDAWMDRLPARLERHLDERDPGRPFYFQLGVSENHRDWSARGTPPDDSEGVHVPPYLHDGPQTRAEMAQFQGMVRRFDEGLGDLLDVVESNGTAGDTIFVLTTDHGIAMPWAKGFLTDAGLETMLFMRFPGRAAERREELVSNIDVLPTLLEACGLKVPARVQGRSLLPLLDGRSTAARESIFGEKTFHDCYDPMRCIRTRRWKYIRNFEKSSLWRPTGDSMRGAYLELGPRAFGGRPAEELYDLQADRAERKNLAEEPGHAEVKEDLRNRLSGWMRRTCDPLLDGPVASPFYRDALAEVSARRTN